MNTGVERDQGSTKRQRPDLSSGSLSPLWSYRKWGEGLLSPSTSPTRSSRASRACALGEGGEHQPTVGREEIMDSLSRGRRGEVDHTKSCPAPGTPKGEPTHQGKLQHLRALWEAPQTEKPSLGSQNFNSHVQKVIFISCSLPPLGTTASRRHPLPEDKALPWHLECVSVSTLAHLCCSRRGERAFWLNCLNYNQCSIIFPFKKCFHW